MFSNDAAFIEQISLDQTIRERMFEHGFANLSMTFYSRSEQSSLLLKGSFMYFQLFMKLLLEMELQDNAKKDLLDMCKQIYAENPCIRDILDEFDRDYTPTKAIFWYTSPTCFYRIINKALRLHDAETMFLCCFFIHDLYQQLKEEHVKFVAKLNNTDRFYVYRGQLLSVDEFNRIREHTGELLSMNSFLSTSTNENVALMFTTTINKYNDGTVSVLFRIEIDTHLQTQPYADIKHLSQFRDENEILIMAGAIFKIESTIWDSVEKIWRVNLSMCTDNAHELQVVFDYCKQYHLTKDRSSLVCLGILSRDLGQTDTAEMFFKKQINIDSHDSWALSGLGYIAKEKGLYDLELDYHKRALQIDLERFSNHPKVAKDYMDLANCLRDRNDYYHALQHYQTSLNLYLDVYDEEHHEIADLYKAMGLLYRSMKAYQTSFDYQQKSFAIAMKTLPLNHPYVADICTTVGWSYYDLGDLNRAFEYIHRAYIIAAKSTPKNSFRMASVCHDLGHIYFKLDNVEKAISYYQEAIAIEAQTVSPMNLLQARTHYELATVYEHNKQHAEALKNYLCAVEMFQCLNTCEQSIKAEEGLHRMKVLFEYLNSS